jgi:hypothetical protein
MFTGLLHWFTGRSPGGSAYEHAFVREVRPDPRVARDARLERFILLCWVIIAVKHGLVLWAVTHYRMPFHPLIVNFPTWLFALLATAIYFRRTAAS